MRFPGKLTVLIFIGWILLVCGCSRDDGVAPDEHGPGILTGTVTSSMTGYPMKYVIVQAWLGGETSTDRDGKYELELDAGSYDVEFSLDWYQEVTHNVEISPGDTTTFDVVLDPYPEYPPVNIFPAEGDTIYHNGTLRLKWYMPQSYEGTRYNYYIYIGEDSEPSLLLDWMSSAENPDTVTYDTVFDTLSSTESVVSWKVVIENRKTKGWAESEATQFVNKPAYVTIVFNQVEHFSVIPALCALMESWGTHYDYTSNEYIVSIQHYFEIETIEWFMDRSFWFLKPTVSPPDSMFCAVAHSGSTSVTNFIPDQVSGLSIPCKVTEGFFSGDIVLVGQETGPVFHVSGEFRSVLRQ